MKIQLEALDLEAAVRTYLESQGFNFKGMDTLFECEGNCTITITPSNSEEVTVVEPTENKRSTSEDKPKTKKTRANKAKKEEPEVVDEDVTSDTPDDVEDLFGPGAGNTVQEETEAALGESDEDTDDSDDDDSEEDARALFA